LVRVNDSVFQSDEAIVAVLAHEMINPGIAKNLHDQAWDVADSLVLAMRKGAK
jgi:hypothetical protein